MKKQNKSEQIRKLLAQDRTPAEISAMLGIPRAHVYTVRSFDKRKQTTHAVDADFVWRSLPTDTKNKLIASLFR